MLDRFRDREARRLPAPDEDPIPSQTPDPGARDSLPRPPGALPEGALSLQKFREVFALPDFRRLFWGQAISALGDWVGTLAFIVAARELAPDQPAAVAAVLILRLLPSFLATPIGGVLSDRWDRKRIMINSDLARFAVIAAVPLVPNIGALYGFAFASECLALVFLPARDASVPNVVRLDQLEAANALVMGSSFAGIPLSGPVFAGLAWAGGHFPSWVYGERIFQRSYSFPFVFDAATFLISAALISRLRLPKHERGPGDQMEHFREALTDGARYILRRPFLRRLAYAVTIAMLGGGVLFALGIGYVRQTLGGSDVGFGWLMGLFGAGMVIGFFVSQLKPIGGVIWMVRISLFVMGGVLIFMAAFPVLWIGYLLAAVFGTAFSVSLIVAMSAVQARTDDEHRGRVMGTVHMLVRGALSIGALGAAAIATAVPDSGLTVFRFHPDKNQVALLIAGGLIAGGTLVVRGRPEGS